MLKRDVIERMDPFLSPERLPLYTLLSHRQYYVRKDTLYLGKARVIDTRVISESVDHRRRQINRFAKRGSERIRRARVDERRDQRGADVGLLSAHGVRRYSTSET